MSAPGANAAGRLEAATDAAPARLPGVRAAVAAALLGAASGVGLEVALGAAGWSFVAWLAPVPLLLAIRRARSVGLAYVAAFSTGCVFWALHIRWTLPLPGVNAANYGVAIALLGALFGLVGPLSWAARWAPTGARWAALAAAWALAEYVRLHVGFASTPWGMLAYSQVGQTPAAQLAAFTGLYGVSFLVVSGAAAISDVMHAARMRRWLLGSARWEVVAPVTVIAAAMLWGGIRVETAVPGAEKLRIGLVQGGTYERGVDPPMRRRQILERYREETRRAAEAGVDLVAWPASSVPGAIPFDTGLVRSLGTLSQEIATPLLVGSSGQAKSSPSQRDRPTANSAFLIDPRGEIVGQYDKIQLLPFNEYQPLRGVLRWPDWVAGDAIDARAGEIRSVFELGDTRFGVLICWENLFPDGFRATSFQGLDFVASLTNEAFTPDRDAHRQMFTMNRLRAIENGIPVIRIATTGVTGAIDRFGRLSAVVSGASGKTRDVVGYRVAEVALGSSLSFYARYGDVFAAACALAIAALVIGRALRCRAVEIR